MTDQQTTSETQTQQPQSGNGSELSGLVMSGVWCCEKKYKCSWQGYALHRGLSWGEIDKVSQAWRHTHEERCGGKLIQLIKPESDYISINNEVVKRETIRIAASLARGDALSRLLERCDKQKTVRTHIVMRDIELVHDFMKKCAIQMRRLHDLL